MPTTVLFDTPTLADALVKALTATKVKRVGFEANYATVGQMKAIEKAMEEAKIAKA